jgi:AcrR family transcriptional regulator
MELSDWPQMHGHILQLEQEGLVTRTFRRLDPGRQQAILTAILDEAIEKGPTSLNIKQVAERAGVSVGSLYNYFVNRDGLLNFAVELCGRFLADVFDSFRPYLASMPLREALMAYMTGGIEWSQTQVGLIQFFLRAAYRGDPDLTERFVRPIATSLRGIVREMLAQAAKRGELREDVDLEATTRVIHALTIAVGDSQLLPYLNTYLQVTGDDLSFEQVLEAMHGLILHGISTQQEK